MVLEKQKQSCEEEEEGGEEEETKVRALGHLERRRPALLNTLSASQPHHPPHDRSKKTRTRKQKKAKLLPKHTAK
jgi:hypothetical protein